MAEVGWLRVAVRDELVAVRPRGIARLDDPSLKKLDTPHLEAAARHIPEYREPTTRVAAIFLLLEHEVPRVVEPYRGWLEVMFALPEELRGRDPGDLRDELAKSLSENKGKFNRTGGKADQAITSLATQIVADCFAEPSDDGNAAESPITKPATASRRIKPWHIAASIITTAGLAGVAILWFSNFNGESTDPNRSDAAQLEARYDGKDPRGLDGSESRCADPPPSQAVPASTPPVFGSDSQQVGSIELRTSPICPVIWARVLWNSDPNTKYQIPAGWTLHVVAHRPETRTTVELTEPSSSGPVPYGLGPMLTTARGCVYVEAYFTHDQQKTHAVPTSCVTAG